MTENRKLDRRSVLKGLGGTAATAAVGATALVSMTGGASATGSFDYGDATVKSDDGTVEYVAIYGDSVVKWDGFDTPAKYFDIDIDLVVEQDWDGQTAAEADLHETGRVDLDNDDWGNYDESLSGSGTSGDIKSGIGLDENGKHDSTIDWHVIGDGSHDDGYGLPPVDDRVDPSAVENGHDGETRGFTLTIKSTYTWYDANENSIFSETFPATVDLAVNNEPKSGSVSDGDGEDGATAA